VAFPREIPKSLVVFDNHLYVGTWNSTTGGEVWRSSDGLSWTQVNSDGFGDARNTAVYSLAVFGGQLYAGTRNDTTGCEVWRSSNGTSWTQVNADGFGDTNDSIPSVAIFDNYLYMGTWNDPTGGEVWRSSNGTSWTQVNTDGFGNANNRAAWSMAVFGGCLYAGTTNGDTGAEVWRSDNGTSWTQVNADGFGDAHNRSATSMVVFDNYLYVGTWSNHSISTGGEVWRSSNGTSWTQVNTDGFGDASNVAAWTMAVFDNYLYVGASNWGTGVEMWRSAGVGGPPFTDWEQVSLDGFGDANNEDVMSMAVLGDQLYMGTWNSSTGTEVWRGQPSTGRTCEIAKQADPDPVGSGAQLAYTVRVTNTSNVTLTATVTDTLPFHIMPGEISSGKPISPGGIITWTPSSIVPGDIWTHTFVVTTEMSYRGPLTNVVEVTTEEGASDNCTQVSTVAVFIYLPAVLRHH
jgi:uncharacterized repeat protein (TIGR01451 family)